MPALLAILDHILSLQMPTQSLSKRLRKTGFIFHIKLSYVAVWKHFIDAGDFVPHFS